jgi:hypothetical protein
VLMRARDPLHLVPDGRHGCGSWFCPSCSRRRAWASPRASSSSRSRPP